MLVKAESVFVWQVALLSPISVWKEKWERKKWSFAEHQTIPPCEAILTRIHMGSNMASSLIILFVVCSWASPCGGWAAAAKAE